MSYYSNLKGVAVLLFGVRSLRPFELAQNRVLRCREYHRRVVVAENRGCLASFEFADAEGPIPPHDQVGLPSRIGVDDVERPSLLNCLHGRTVADIPAGTVDSLEQSRQLMVSAVNDQVDVLGGSRLAVKTAGDGSKEHVGNLAHAEVRDES